MKEYKANKQKIKDTVRGIQTVGNSIGQMAQFLQQIYYIGKKEREKCGNLQIKGA